jgi:hypothetical protein
MYFPKKCPGNTSLCKYLVFIVYSKVKWWTKIYLIKDTIHLPVVYFSLLICTMNLLAREAMT